MPELVINLVFYTKITIFKEKSSTANMIPIILFRGNKSGWYMPSASLLFMLLLYLKIQYYNVFDDSSIYIF